MVFKKLNVFLSYILIFYKFKMVEGQAQAMNGGKRRRVAKKTTKPKKTTKGKKTTKKCTKKTCKK